MPIPPKRKGRFDWLPQPMRRWVFEWKSLARVEKNYLLGFARWVARRVRPSATVLFYPDVPKLGSVAFFLSSALGYRITNDPRVDVDAVVFYHDATVSDARSPAEIVSGRRAVNAGCRDIRKTHVQDVFARVFGYPLAVDPLTFTGPMVEKSDDNATKDARIVNGPLRPEQVRDGYVYQRRVDARVDGGWIEEMRIPVYGDAISVVSVRRQPAGGPLIARASRTDVVEPEEALSPEEIDRVVAFARELRMDFGAMDAMRDARDGRLYILDANTTPNGPTSRVSDDAYSWSVVRLARDFEALLLPPERRPKRRTGARERPKSIDVARPRRT